MASTSSSSSTSTHDKGLYLDDAAYCMLKEVMADLKAEFEYGDENRRYVKFTDVVVPPAPPPSFASGGWGGFVTVPPPIIPKPELFDFTNETIVTYAPPATHSRGGGFGGFGGPMNGNIDRRVPSLARFILSLKQVMVFNGPSIMPNWTSFGASAPYSITVSPGGHVDMVLVKYLYTKQRMMEHTISQLIHAVTAIQSTLKPSSTEH